jgi:HK97 family phage major capsid protein
MKTLLELAREERARLVAEADAVIAAAEAEQRNLTEDEWKIVEAASPKNNEQVRALDERIAGLEARQAALDVAAREVPTGGAKVRREERTYHPENDPKGERFLLDVAARHMGDWEAGQRLARHMQEERTERRDVIHAAESRAAGTGAFAGLVVPQYLVDMYAPAAAAGRQFANICRKHPLPEKGMTVNISRITTATSAATQTENANVSETDIDDTLLTENIFTVAGQQTLSRQAIERGILTEDVTLDDLIRRYHTVLDLKLITDTTTGLTNVAQSVSYTDGTPTAAELYPKLLQAQAQLEAVYLDRAVNPDRLFAVMHSRRWYWLGSQFTSTWPFLQQPGIAPQIAAASEGAAYTASVRGVLPNGCRVVVDNNVPTNLGAGTNEDEIYMVNADECHLWEDPNAPMLIRTENTKAASLGVLFVIYGYAAYTHRRYTNGHQKVAGTGLVNPTF